MGGPYGTLFCTLLEPAIFTRWSSFSGTRVECWIVPTVGYHFFTSTTREGFFFFLEGPTLHCDLFALYLLGLVGLAEGNVMEDID